MKVPGSTRRTARVYLNHPPFRGDIIPRVPPLSRSYALVIYGLGIGGVVSPVRRPARQLAILLGIALFAALFLAIPVSAQDPNATPGEGNESTGGGEGTTANLGVPADAPQPEAGKIVRVLTFGAIDEGTCPGGAPAPCWDVLNLVAEPGDVVVLHANLVNRDLPHNLHIIEPGAAPAAASPGPKSQTAGNAVHTATMVMPADGELTFICDVHPDTMVGHVVTAAAAAESSGAHASVPTLGVHFLAYWVGLIAFAILFVVYGITFFLFKYNETRAATDHWDRSEPGAGSKRLAAVAPLLAVVLAIAAMAAIIWFATR